MDKKILRSMMREQRKSITPTEALRYGKALAIQLQSLITEKQQNIAVYFAEKGEIDLHYFIEDSLPTKNLYTPIATKESREMRFEQILNNQVKPMFVNIDYELNQEIKCYNLDLIILPLVAVDKNGYRLGQGGGYYDTTLANLEKPPLLCGVGYDWQMIDEVPREKWDIPLDYFVSEQRIYKFK